MNTPDDGIYLTEGDLRDIHQSITHALGMSFIVAGGAVRDVLFGRPAKDIDVWLPAERLSLLPLALKALEAHGKGTWKQVLPGFRAEYMSMGDILDIVEVTLPDVPLPIQLITTAIPSHAFTVSEVLDRMDMELCRCALLPGAMPGQMWPWATQGALDDYRKRTFTVRRQRSDKDIERTQRRIERLSKKYPGFTPVWEPSTDAV